MSFWEPLGGVGPGALTSKALLRAMEAMRDAPPDPCARGGHVVHPRARYRPGSYVCGNCGARVDVPFPLSER